MKSRNTRINSQAFLLKNQQSGQSSVEYITVSAFAVIVLLVPDSSGNVAVIQLANAIKTYYNAFAYAISFSSTITPF